MNTDTTARADLVLKKISELAERVTGTIVLIAKDKEAILLSFKLTVSDISLEVKEGDIVLFKCSHESFKNYIFPSERSRQIFRVCMNPITMAIMAQGPTMSVAAKETPDVLILKMTPVKKTDKDDFRKSYPVDFGTVEAFNHVFPN